MRSALFASAILALTANATIDACGLADYETAMLNFAMGFQNDVTDTTTDCYEKTGVFASKTGLLIESLQNFTLDNWAEPLYILSELAVSSTDVFTYCQTTNFAKQFAVRMNSLSGFFDLCSTIGVAYLKQYVTDPDAADNYLYIAIDGMITDSTCAGTANYLGQSLQYAFAFTVADSYYVDELSLNLVDEILG